MDELTDNIIYVDTTKEITFVDAKPGDKFSDVVHHIKKEIDKSQCETTIYILKFNSQEFYIDYYTNEDFLQKLFYYKKKEEKYITNLKCER